MKKIIVLTVIVLSISILLISMNQPFKVNADKCIGCQLCISKCPVGAITMVKGKAVIDAEKCIGCGICADGDGNSFDGCPVKAINQISPEKTKSDTVITDSTKIDSLKK